MKISLIIHADTIFAEVCPLEFIANSFCHKFTYTVLLISSYGAIYPSKTLTDYNYPSFCLQMTFTLHDTHNFNGLDKKGLLHMYP